MGSLVGLLRRSGMGFGLHTFFRQVVWAVNDGQSRVEDGKLRELAEHTMQHERTSGGVSSHGKSCISVLSTRQVLYCEGVPACSSPGHSTYHKS